MAGSHLCGWSLRENFRKGPYTGKCNDHKVLTIPSKLDRKNWFNEIQSPLAQSFARKQYLWVWDDSFARHGMHSSPFFDQPLEHQLFVHMIRLSGRQSLPRFFVLSMRRFWLRLCSSASEYFHQKVWEGKGVRGANPSQTKFWCLATVQFDWINNQWHSANWVLHGFCKNDSHASSDAVKRLMSSSFNGPGLALDAAEVLDVDEMNWW